MSYLAEDADDLDDVDDQLQKDIERACSQPTPDGCERPTGRISSSKLRKLRKRLDEANVLSDNETLERRQVLLELGASQDSQVLDVLIEHAADNSSVIREGAITALGELGDPSGLPTALKALLDLNDDVVRAAFSTIKKIGDRRGVRPLLRFGIDRPKWKPLANDSLVKLGPRVLQELLTVLQSGESGITLDAIVVLGRIGDKQAVSPLIACLDHISDLLRAHVIEALSLIGDSRAVPQMLRALEHPNSAVRANAASGLVRMADPRSLRPLLNALQDEDEDVRRYAAVAIGELGDTKAVPELIPILTAWEQLVELDSGFLEVVVETLGKLKDPQAVPTLIPLLQAKHDGVLLKTVLALKQLRDPSAAAALLSLLRSPKSMLRRRVVETLGQTGDLTAIPTIGGLLKQDGSSEVRAAAARALGELKAKEACPFLEDALRDEIAVRCQAVIALGAIREKKSLAALMAMLKDGAPEVRYHAINAVAKFQDPKTLKALAVLVADADSMVKTAAEKALEAFGDAVKGDKTVATIVKKARTRDLAKSLIPSWVYLLVPTSTTSRAIVAGIAATILMMPLLIRAAIGGPDKVAVRGNVQTLAMSADGSVIVAERTLGLIEVWDVKGQSLKSNTSSSGFRKPIFRSNGEAVLLNDTTVVPWSLSGQPDLESGWKEHKTTITKSAVSPDGKLAVTVSRDLMATIWDLEAGRKKGTVELTERYSNALSLSPDGKLLAAGNSRGEVALIELESGKSVNQFISRADGPGKPLVVTALSPDGKWLAAADQAGSVHFWETDAEANSMPANSIVTKAPLRVIGLRFLPDSRRVVSVDAGGDVRTWHVEKEESQPLLSAEIEQVDGFAFDAEGKFLALGGNTVSPIFVFDLESGEQVKKLDIRSR